MLKKTIEFEDYEGKQRKMDAYFHLTNTELTKWLLTDGDYTLDKKIARLFEQRNASEIMSTFEQLIDSSYGVKSLDGVQFQKSPEILAAFKNSPAYDKLFMELITDSSKAADFFNGIVPKDTAEQIKKTLDENPEAIPAEIRDYIPKKEEN